MDKSKRVSMMTMLKEMAFETWDLFKFKCWQFRTRLRFMYYDPRKGLIKPLGFNPALTAKQLEEIEKKQKEEEMEKDLDNKAKDLIDDK